MNILITGVAGLIGSNFAEWILNNTEHNVIGVDDLSGGYIENIPWEKGVGRLTFYEQNIVKDKTGFTTLEEIFTNHKIDLVYQAQAYAAEGLSPFIRQYNYENNLIATTRIINMSIKYNIRRLIYFSSMSVYGNNNTPFVETMQPAPIDPYAIAKYACEMDIKVANKQHGLDYCIIRPHNVMGRKQNIWDKYRNVLGIWMYQHLNNNPMTIFGDGLQKRAFSYIDDAMEPLYNAAIFPEASKQIINLGGITEVSILDAAKTLIEVIGDGKIVHLEPRHEVKYAWSTYQKSVDILNFEHKTSLKEGLTKMWEWAKKQPMRKQFKWNKYELDKGIYSYWR